MSDKDVLKLQIKAWEENQVILMQQKSEVIAKSYSVLKEVTALTAENQKVLIEAEQINNKIEQWLKDVSYYRCNLHFKMEELKVIEQSTEVYNEKQHESNIKAPNINDFDVDLSKQEEYFKEIKQNILISLQRIVQTNSCIYYIYPNPIAKNSPSYKTVDKSLSKSLEALKQNKADLANEITYTKNKIDMAIKAQETIRYRVNSEGYFKRFNLV